MESVHSSVSLAHGDLPQQAGKTCRKECWGCPGAGEGGRMRKESVDMELGLGSRSQGSSAALLPREICSTLCPLGKKPLTASAKIYFREHPNLLKYHPEHLIWENTFGSPVESGAQPVRSAAPQLDRDGPSHVLPRGLPSLEIPRQTG